VQTGAPDRTTLISGDGRVAANISISQQIGANILDVRAGIESALTELARALPAGLRISKTYDLAEFVATAIANVRDAIIVGGFLAVIVLLLFLRDWRLTLVASVTLPLTVITTFLVMKWLGQTINVMSMGGMAVAIGLVIDDAVVMVENIYRHLDSGESASQAVQFALRELFAPVVGSTLTTVVVFVPLGMLSGVVGQFFRALSITLSAAVLISLVQALTLIPLLARAAAQRREAPVRSEHHAGRLERAYLEGLGATMRRPTLGILAAIVLAVAGGALFMALGTGFLPEADEGGFVIDYRSPAGTALEETNRILQKVEGILQQTPEIAAFTRRTGSELGLFATQQTKGDILVRLKPRSQRRSADEVITDLRDKLTEAAPQLEIEFIQLLQDMLGDLEGAPTPIEVKVFGDEAETLASISEDVEKLLEGVKGVVDIVGVQRGNPETTWDIDKVSAGRLGLTIAQVSEQLSDAWLGDVRTELRLADRTIPVRVRYPDAYRLDPAQMAATPVRSSDGKTVPLGTLAQATTTEGEIILQRENLRQMALVTGRLEGRDLGSAVDEIQTKLRGLKLPVGFTTEVGGQYASQRQSFRELLTVFAIAVALVFTILVIQFGRFLPALLIILAAPLSLAGAFALLLLTGTVLNVSSAMGLILLVGLVVKNGIVLLDYAHRLNAEGHPFTEALEIAGLVRLRPILMTTLCTLFGLLPLALGFGAGAELQRPLALAVIGGLTLSTFVTLFLVPLAYRALRRAA
jgi:multidrug efflux pump subunit AcrB